MKNNKTLLITIGVAALALGGAFLYFKYGKKKENSEESNTVDGGGENSPPPQNTVVTTQESNYNKLMSLLGNNKKESKDGVTAFFNDKKNFANFYKGNGRVFIYDAASKKIVKKGSYSNGGLTMTMDGMSPISSSSVWTNLNSLIKQKEKVTKPGQGLYSMGTMK